MDKYIKELKNLTINDIPLVGGKNASLGEMIGNLETLGIRVPGGFATTSIAYHEFLHYHDLSQQIDQQLNQLDINNIEQLQQTGATIRNWILNAHLHPGFEQSLEQAYQQMIQIYGTDCSWAVRSSATAEDLPEASFAGQQESYLNISGLDNLKSTLLKVYASLFTDRAIAYRVHQGFSHESIALSVGIQKMVRSDLAASGVMFSLDTESGFEDVVFITGNYGLGETVVQGAVNPDEFYVYKTGIKQNNPAILRRNLGNKLIKMIYASDACVETVNVDPQDQNRFCINDQQIEELARQALIIEQHYAQAMDMEWALDGQDGQLYIVQARPETVQSQTKQVNQRYQLQQKSKLLLTGRAIGNRIGHGKARVIQNLEQMQALNPGDVLITDMTDPDWEPVMKIASAIITNRGGRTCHAAIIARELGVPAVVGCNHATELLAETDWVTVSCAEGDTGYIYEGKLDYSVSEDEVPSLSEMDVKIMMNVGNPDRAFDFCQLPNQGVGLARMEFIINNMIGIHPKALLDYEQLAPALKSEISNKISAYADPVSFFINKLVEGIATICAAFYPKPVILRLSDFKSNEYAHLLAGNNYEPPEENPMLGFRGASRYISDEFKACFELECQAIQYVREAMALDNLQIMVPFVRTVTEAKSVSELLTENGLKRGQNGLKHIMMCEIPSNALLATDFLKFFDGFSIGSNDMTQLVLGLDRDSALVANSFDERNPAIKRILKMAIEACQKENKYIGICGQGPSDHPDFAAWLLSESISSISLNPDTVIDTWQSLSSLAHQKTNNI